MRVCSGLLFLALLPALAQGEIYRPDLEPRLPEDKDAQGVFVVDGSFVHNVGEVQLNITNWGLIGSRPSIPATYSNAPSAMWPAASGVDYLFAAGLWIGGVRNGVPLVSTGQFENEFLPTRHPLDTIYRSKAGEPGGARYPQPDEDDDRDGKVDEDPKNGYDDDGDGLIDEDFGVISEQQFRLRMLDNLPVISELWPDHDPLHLEVIQESYQWSSPSVEDAIGFDFTIRNVGVAPIEDLVVGFFADCDIGLRSGETVSIDDMVGFHEETVIASDRNPLRLSIAYMYDCDGDNNVAPGYIGFVFVNGSNIPVPQPIHTFRYFTGVAPYERGGDPTTDAERYEVLTSGEHQPLPISCRAANDYRILIATRLPGSSQFGPGRTLRFQMAIVMGEDLRDLVDNAAEIILTYYGQWFDKDRDRRTGIRGREKKICLDDFGGPRVSNNPIFNMYIDCAYPPDCDPFQRPKTIKESDLDEEGCVWIDGDCAYEQWRGTGCGICYIDYVAFNTVNVCTDLVGREHNVRWLTDSPPPPPPMRLWETDNCVHVFWRGDPELETDPITGFPLFESYRVWRSDGWDRPLGTSVETGPKSTSWTILAEYDRVGTYVNRVGHVVEEIPLGANTGLDVVRYDPLVSRPNTQESSEYLDLSRLVDQIVEDHPDLHPLTPIRYRDDQGGVTPLGEAYPELEEWECCYDQVDTLAWGKLGLSFYEYVDRKVLNGFYYFHAVTMTTLGYDGDDPTVVGYGPAGQPRANFQFSVPQSRSQTPEEVERVGPAVYVVPNPATEKSLGEFSELHPNSEDPTGVRVEFRNLPRARNIIRIFTLSGDLVATLEHDGRGGAGSKSWNLVSRKGQEVAGGIYLYSVESDDGRFSRVIGRFVIIR